MNFLDEKKLRLEKILPELEAKTKKQEEKPKATIFQGARGIKEILNLMLETKTKEYFGYGGSKISNEILGEYFWDNFHTKRVNKKIHAKLLFHQSLKYWGKILSKRRRTTVKYTSQEFEELTETIICGERVAIIIYLDKPVGFLIEEKNVASSYKNFFEILWKSAKN